MKLYQCPECRALTDEPISHTQVFHPGKSITYDRCIEGEHIAGIYNPTPGPVIYEPVSPSARVQESNSRN